MLIHKCGSAEAPPTIILETKDGGEGEEENDGGGTGVIRYSAIALELARDRCAAAAAVTLVSLRG